MAVRSATSRVMLTFTTSAGSGLRGGGGAGAGTAVQSRQDMSASSMGLNIRGRAQGFVNTIERLNRDEIRLQPH